MPRRSLVALVLLLLAVLGAYGPALRGGFVWDDDDYVLEEETLVEDGGLRRIWVEPGATPQYYPLVFTTFWVERRLYGEEPFGFHLTNVLLHGLAAWLLGLVLARLRVPGGWLAAALFALHPVHVESVAWITERKNVLSGALYLGALLAWLRWDRLDGPPPLERRGGTRHPAAWWLALGLFALALFSKTVTCSLPAAILLLAWWRRGRVTWADVLPLLPFLALGAWLASTTARLEAEHVSGGMLDLGLSSLDRVVLAGRAVWFYLGKLLWPAELVFVYPRWVVDAGAPLQWVYPLAAAAGLAGLWLLRGRLGRGPLVAALFFGGTLLPALGFVDVFPMTYSWVADHFQYLASLGPIVLVAAAAARGLERWTERGARPVGARAARAAGVVAAAVVLVALGTLTWRQGHAYRDLETLWRDVLSKNPDAAMAHVNLGNLLSDRGEYEAALEHHRAVFSVDPPERDTFVLARAHYNSGNQLMALRRHAEAEAEYSAAIAVEPRYPPAYYGRGQARRETGDLEGALADFEAAVRMDPGNAAARQAVDHVRRRLPRR